MAVLMLSADEPPEEIYDNLPSRPERPLDSDCCGQGCIPCVFDLYEEEVKIWEDECRKVAVGESSQYGSPVQEEGPLLTVQQYRKFTIESVTKETKDTFRFKFKLPYGRKLGLKTGQHVIVRGTVNGEIVTRQYTPVSDVEEKSYFTLLIKIYDYGKFSQYIKTWSAGSEILVRGPFGSLDYKPNKFKKMYMLAVGTGIAPMSQVIETVLNNEDEDTIIQLLYGCRTYEDILMKKELQEWSRYWNFSCQYHLSQEDETSNPGYGYGKKILFERISLRSLQETIVDLSDSIFIFLCGTRSFEKDMIDNMTLLGISSCKYHKF